MIVARMATGDHRALGELYDRWSSVVQALAFRILGDRDDAEETVEDTFWQLWRQAGSYEHQRGGVATWVLTIARSRALDRRRAMARRRTEPLGDFELGTVGHDASRFVAEGDDPATAAELSERRSIVVAALAELPVEQRETLELAYFGGLSQSEIAERTGQPLGTVKTRMRLASHKLRDALSHLRTEGASQ